MTQKRNWFVLISLLGFCLAIVSCGSSPNPAPSDAITSPNPAPSDAITSPNPAASDAIKELRKMSGAVEMGLNLQEYTKRMIDMKAEVDEKLAEIPDGELKQEVKAAQQVYIDAKTLWNSAATSDNVHVSKENRAIFEKYNFTLVRNDGNMIYSIPKKEALSGVWATAGKHIEKATELNRKK